MKIKTVISCLFFFTSMTVATIAIAGEPDLEQFAKGYELKTDGSAAIYKLDLPQSIYQTTVRSDLGDIRVFNKDKKRVPHAIRRPGSNQEKGMIHLDLAFFPLHGSDNSRRNTGTSLEFKVADDGTIIKIHSGENFSVADNADIRRYLIDTSGVNQSIDELEFELTGVESGFIKRAQLQYSDNLNDWYNLVDNFSIAELDYGSHKLHKNKVTLPKKNFRYLRFVWKEKPDGIQLKNIKARINTVWTSHHRQRLEVSGQLVDSEKQIYEFDLGGRFPLDRINIILPEENTLIEAEINSRNNEESEWRRRYTGLIYNLQVKENSIESGEINIRPTRDQLWQLQVKTQDGLGDELPVLEFAWAPNELYFLARGQGPFTLAYGNGQIDPPGKPIDVLMNVLTEDQEQNLVGEAELGTEVSLMGDDALKAELEIPWRRILLWGVLILGVLILGIMVFRLYKQMATPEK
ncbi:MAG: hypothetical protein DRQ58_07440 [Gammaproteobacteria bacterium]|nr:MAG: hypothetical protein DRQ58_07440 [Gammaproteobacteria bacterium]